MKRALLILLFAVATAAAQSPQVDARALEGVWEFVSQTTDLTRPKAERQVRAAPEWVGLWIFHDGYYSRVLTKSQRDIERFLHPKDSEDMEFDAASGPYQCERGKLLLMKPYAFAPLAYVSRDEYSVTIRGDTLTLVDQSEPHVERMSAGTITIILARKH